MSTGSRDGYWYGRLARGVREPREALAARRPIVLLRPRGAAMHDDEEFLDGIAISPPDMAWHDPRPQENTVPTTPGTDPSLLALDFKSRDISSRVTRDYRIHRK